MRLLPASTSGLCDASEATPRGLDRDDWAELSRIRHEPTRKRKIAVRTVLRFALSKAVGGQVPSSAWRFARSPGGRPFVALRIPKVYFSVSHTDGLSVIAVSRICPVGIDTEVEQSRADTQFIQSFLSRRELVAIASIAPEERPAALMRFWTLKEAYAKLVGIGVSADFRSLEFALDAPRDTYDPGAPEEYMATRFRTWRWRGPCGPCHVALATGHPQGIRQYCHG